MSGQEHDLEALVEGAIVDAARTGYSQGVQGPNGTHVIVHGSERAEDVVKELRGE